MKIRRERKGGRETKEPPLYKSTAKSPCKVRPIACCGPQTCSHLCNSGTVSTLCAYTSKPDRATFSTALRSPRKSGVRHSTRIFGFLEGKKISPEWKKRTDDMTAAYTAVPAGPG